MPIYDRQCESCSKVWETEEPMEENPNASKSTCPKCGSDKTKRIITGRRNFVLVGNRWAKDGYSG